MPQTDMENNNQKQEKPLDPSVERIRRKLMWFMIISTAITFLLVFGAVAAVVYKVMQPIKANKVETPISLSEAIAAPTDNHIPLPPQSRIISQSVSGELISLHLVLSDGSNLLIIYNYVSKQDVFKAVLKDSE